MRQLRPGQALVLAFPRQGAEAVLLLWVVNAALAGQLLDLFSAAGEFADRCRRNAADLEIVTLAVDGVAQRLQPVRPAGRGTPPASRARHA